MRHLIHTLEERINKLGAFLLIIIDVSNFQNVCSSLYTGLFHAE